MRSSGTVVLMIGLSCCNFIQPAAAQDLIIRHVTVVSPERVTALQNATVAIHDGKIESVSNKQDVRTPKSAVTIEGAGLFLSPGLIDSHVHTNELAGTQGREQKIPEIMRALREQQPRSFLYFG